MHRTQGNCKRKRDADKSQGTIFDFFMPKPHRDDDGRGPPPGGSFSGAGGGGGILMRSHRHTSLSPSPFPPPFWPIVTLRTRKSELPEARGAVLGGRGGDD